MCPGRRFGRRKARIRLGCRWRWSFLVSASSQRDHQNCSRQRSKFFWDGFKLEGNLGPVTFSKLSLCPVHSNLQFLPTTQKLTYLFQIRKLIVAKDGLLSTPALSRLIRSRKYNNGSKIHGGIILTVSGLRYFKGVIRSI